MLGEGEDEITGSAQDFTPSRSRIIPDLNLSIHQPRAIAQRLPLSTSY
jgi:hypothetical protein